MTSECATHYTTVPHNLCEECTRWCICNLLLKNDSFMCYHVLHYVDLKMCNSFAVKDCSRSEGESGHSGSRCQRSVEFNDFVLFIVYLLGLTSRSCGIYRDGLSFMDCLLSVDILYCWKKREHYSRCCAVAFCSVHMCELRSVSCRTNVLVMTLNCIHTD